MSSFPSIPHLVMPVSPLQGVAEAGLSGYRMGQDMNHYNMKLSEERQQQYLRGLEQFDAMNGEIKNVYDTSYKEYTDGGAEDTVAGEGAARAANAKYIGVLGVLKQAGAPDEFLAKLPKVWTPDTYNEMGGALVAANAKLNGHKLVDMENGGKQEVDKYGNLVKYHPPVAAETEKYKLQTVVDAEGNKIGKMVGDMGTIKDSEVAPLGKEERPTLAPHTRTFKNNGYEITQEWDTESGKWQDVAKNRIESKAEARTATEEAAARRREDATQGKESAAADKELKDLEKESRRLDLLRPKDKKGKPYPDAVQEGGFLGIGSETVENPRNASWLKARTDLDTRIVEAKAERTRLSGKGGDTPEDGAGAGQPPAIPEGMYKVRRGMAHNRTADTSALVDPKLQEEVAMALAKTRNPAAIAAKLRSKGISPGLYLPGY